MLICFSCVRLFVTLCTIGPGYVHCIFQARILEWVAMPSSRGSSWHKAWTHGLCTAGRFTTTEPPGKPRPHTRENRVAVKFWILFSCLYPCSIAVSRWVSQPPWSGLSYVFYFAFWYDFKWDALLYFPILLAWRHAGDFHILILYIAEFTSAKSWCVIALGCSMYTVTSSAWCDSITAFLPIWTPFTSVFVLFCFVFFWLLWLGFPISCWIEMVLVGILICSRFQWEGNHLVTSEHYVGYGLVLHCLFPSLLWEEYLW